jgi:hypothetical protein
VKLLALLVALAFAGPGRLALTRVRPLAVEPGRPNTVELLYRGEISEAGRPSVAVEWEVHEGSGVATVTERALLSVVGPQQWSASVPLDLTRHPTASRVVGRALAYLDGGDPAAEPLGAVTTFELKVGAASAQPTAVESRSP